MHPSAKEGSQSALGSWAHFTAISGGLTWLFLSQIISEGVVNSVTLFWLSRVYEVLSARFPRQR
jgi:hypothetical protein